MPSFLSNIFNSSSSVDTSVGATRTINLSGNYFSFSMPEDFSKDMPAENLVENLDITNLEKFNNTEYGNLIRRWWDIKKPGLFGKNLGTIMMDISVQRVVDNKQRKIHDRAYKISDRLDFLLMINDALHQRYDEFIAQTKGLNDALSYSVPGIAFLSGKKLKTECRDSIYNNQKWVAYSATAPINQLIGGLVTPLTEQLYLEVVYSYSPDQNVLPMSFLDLAYKKTSKISNTLKITYEKDNVVKDLINTKDWLKTTNDQILQRNQDILLVPLFGSDAHKLLEMQDKLDAEAAKSLMKIEGSSY
jgi:hypothetical protein